MKKLLYICLAFCVLGSPCFAGKVVDININQNHTLVDKKGGMTSGQTSAVSARTATNPQGILQTFWGDRDQLIDTSAQNDITDGFWARTRIGKSTAQAIVADTTNNSHILKAQNKVIGGETYIFSADFKQGVVNSIRIIINTTGTKPSAFFNLAGSGLGTNSGFVIPEGSPETLSDGWYRCSVAFTASDSTDDVFINPSDGEDRIFIGQDDPDNPETHIRNIMLEKLPSGNVIGSDLFDQESLGSELYDVANAVGDSGGNEADATTGWTVAGSLDIYESQSAVKSTGSYAFHLNANGSPAAGARLWEDISGLGLVEGTVYQMAIDARHVGTGGDWVIAFGDTNYYSDNPLVTLTSTDTSFTTYTREFIYDGINILINARELNGSDDGGVYLDNFIIKEITAPHLGTYDWPYSAGDGGGDDSDAIDDDNDRTFEDGNIGNWTLHDDSTDSTLTYDSNDLGYGGVEPGDHKQGLITVDETTDPCTYAYGRLSTTEIDGLSTNTLFRISVKIAVPAANNLKSVRIKPSAFSDDIPGAVTETLSGDTWTEVVLYNYFATDIVGNIDIGFGGNPADGDLLYYDDVSIRPVQTSGVPYGTNKMEIDETNGNMQISYVDDDRGAYLDISDATDFTDDSIVNVYYMVNVADAYFETLDGDAPKLVIMNNADDTVLAEVTLTTSTAPYELVFRATHATGDHIEFDNMSGSEIVHIGDITIKRIPDFALLEPSDFVNDTSIPAQDVIGQVGDSGVGAIISGAGVNLLPYSEDFSQWTTYQMWDFLTQDGPDNENNSATYLLANAANATIKYTLSETLDGSDYTFSVWMKRLGGTGNVDLTEDNGGSWTTKTLSTSWERFDITGTETDPVVGIRIVADTDSVAIYGANITPTPYLLPYIPSNGNPVAMTSMAADGTYGVQFTQSELIKSVYGTGAPANRGTTIIEWVPLQDYDAVDTSSRGFFTIKGASGPYTPLYFSSVEGRIVASDGLYSVLHSGLNWSRNDQMITVLRHDSEEGENGYLHLANSKNGVFDLSVSATGFNDAFTPDGVTWLLWGDELPKLIKRIIVYDEVLSDADLLLLVWDANNYNYTSGLIRPLIYPVVSDLISSFESPVLSAETAMLWNDDNVMLWNNGEVMLWND